ncbi:7TM diverse intracellular signaling (fragment) [Cupriavidus taiwanensis]
MGAGVEFQAGAQRGEVVEPQRTRLVAEVMRVRQFQHVAHRPVERAQPGWRAPARVQAGGLRHGRGLQAGRVAEAAQVDVGIAQFHVDIAVVAVAFPVEHHRSAQAIGIHDAVFEEGDVAIGLVLDRELGDGQVAGDAAERSVEDGAEHQLLAWDQRKIPADANGAGEGVPFGRQLAGFQPVGGDKGGVVAVVGDRPFQIERKRLAQRKAPAELPQGQVRVVGAGTADGKRAGRQVRYDRKRHQRQHRTGVLLHIGADHAKRRLGLRQRGHRRGRKAGKQHQHQGALRSHRFPHPVLGHYTLHHTLHHTPHQHRDNSVIGSGSRLADRASRFLGAMVAEVPRRQK